MIRSPTYLHPRIALNKLPEDEHNHARFVDILLHDLGRRCADFEAALKLFDQSIVFLENAQNHVHYPEEYRLQWHWRGFAAREAVSTIYRVDEDLEYANKNLNKCPTLCALVNHDKKREAGKLFRKSFPGVDRIRHGVQHFAKLYGTPESFAQHVSGEVNYYNHIDGRTIKTMFEGRDASLEFNEDALSKLRGVRDLYWASYMEAATE